MLLVMMVLAVSATLINISYWHNHFQLALIFTSITISFDNYVHWMFCYIYLKLQIEVKYLLDSHIYTGNQ